MDKKPKISVITVCRNGVSTIEPTIRSIVDQTYENIEYIIIDGGSTDGTVDIIKQYAEGGSEALNHKHCIAKWISEPDHGIYDAMNKGITFATGDYINFMNAGDSFANEIVLAHIANEIDDRTVIAYGDWNVSLNGIKHKRSPLDWSYIYKQIPFCHQAAFYKTQYHKEHLFPSELKLVGDYKIVYDAYLSNHVRFQYIPEIVADYDITVGNSASIDQYRKSLNEKYIVWGIQNQFLLKLPHEIGNLMTTLSYLVRKHLSPKMIMKVKNIKNSFRKHQ